jgi:hypothetical protein
MCVSVYVCMCKRKWLCSRTTASSCMDHPPDTNSICPASSSRRNVFYATQAVTHPHVDVSWVMARGGCACVYACMRVPVRVSVGVLVRVRVRVPVRVSVRVRVHGCVCECIGVHGCKSACGLGGWLRVPVRRCRLAPTTFRKRASPPAAATPPREWAIAPVQAQTGTLARRHTHTHSLTHSSASTGRRTHRHTGTRADRYTDTQAHASAFAQHTDTQTHKHTDTHTHRLTYTHRHVYTQMQPHTRTQAQAEAEVCGVRGGGEGGCVRR